MTAPAAQSRDARGEGRAAMNSVAAIAQFLRGFSLEATRPRPADIEALKAAAPAGTQVYLSAIPTRPPQDVLAQAVALRAAGFEPVPHLAARNFESASALSDLLAQLAAQAGVARVLVIAGDREDPAGPFAGALEVIDSGLLQRHGIRAVGISGHPEGHPRLSPQTLARAMAAKLDCAEQSGLEVEIVSQFCFDPHTIMSWIGKLRDLGIENRVRVGMAGPTSLTTLLRFAARCGVKASAAGAVRQAGLMKHLFSVSAPDAVARPIAQAGTASLGEIAAHFFSFGGVDATARWAANAAAGRITLDNEGFSVEPP